MKIKSERLLLYPVSDDEMQSLINEQKDDDLRKAYSEMLQGCLDAPENRIWYAVWYMELKDQPGTIIGDLSFKGLGPDGTVEIGYGLRDGFCGNGYMTEAVRTISAWAVSQEGVTGVEAETTPDNTASERVLLNAGFRKNGKYGEEGPRYVYQTGLNETE